MATDRGRPAIGTLKLTAEELDPSNFENKDYPLLVSKTQLTAMAAEDAANQVPEPEIDTPVDTGDDAGGAGRPYPTDDPNAPTSGITTVSLPAYVSPLAIPEGAQEGFEYWSAGELMSFQLDVQLGARWESLGMRAMMDSISLVKSLTKMSTNLYNIISGAPWETSSLAGDNYGPGAEGFVKYLESKVGLPYPKTKFCERTYNRMYSETMGPHTYDCSGLFCCALKSVGIAPFTDGRQRNTDTLQHMARTQGGLILGKVPTQIGDFAIMGNASRYGATHVVMYIGNDETIEAGDGTGRVGRWKVARATNRTSFVSWYRLPQLVKGWSSITTAGSGQPGNSRQNSPV